MLFDDQVMIFEAVSDGWSLTLHGVVVDINDANKLLKGDKSYIIFLVG